MSNDRHKVTLLENAEPWREAYSIIHGITLSYPRSALFPQYSIFPALAQAEYSPFYSTWHWAWNPANSTSLTFAGTVPSSSSSLPQFRISEVSHSWFLLASFPSLMFFQCFLIAVQVIFLKLKLSYPSLKFTQLLPVAPREGHSLKLTRNVGSTLLGLHLSFWPHTFPPFFCPMPRPHCTTFHTAS